MLRMLIGGFALAYVAGRLPHLLRIADFGSAQFAPVGVVTALEGPLSASIHQIVTALTAIAAVPFVLGYRFRLTGPLFAALLLWSLSYRNSWGMIFHTENLLVIHVALLGLAPSADAWSLDARASRAQPGDLVSYGWVIKLMCLVTCLTYLLAGIAKLRYGGDAWMSGDILRSHIALDAVKKEVLGSTSSPLAAPLIRQTWLFTALALATMVLEVGAPAAMAGGKIALVWVLGVVAFHYGVLALMAIAFPYPMSGIAFASFFRCERLGRWLARRYKRWRSRARRRRRR